MPDIYLERNPVVVCQCIPPCLMPFKEPSGEWATMGCLRPQGHEPPCSVDGPGDFTYREPAENLGPRIVMRPEGDDTFRGQCPRCGRWYGFGAVSIGMGSLVAAATAEEPLMAARMGKCARCGNEDLLLAGLCGSCGDDIRQGADADRVGEMMTGIRLEERPL